MQRTALSNRGHVPFLPFECRISRVTRTQLSMIKGQLKKQRWPVYALDGHSLMLRLSGYQNKRSKTCILNDRSSLSMVARSACCTLLTLLYQDSHQSCGWVQLMDSGSREVGVGSSLQRSLANELRLAGRGIGFRRECHLIQLSSTHLHILIIKPGWILLLLIPVDSDRMLSNICNDQAVLRWLDLKPLYSCTI